MLQIISVKPTAQIFEVEKHEVSFIQNKILKPYTLN